MSGVTNRRLWLTAGWLAIAYVVVTFAASPAYTAVVGGIGDKPSEMRKALVTSSMTKGYAGGYVLLVATLIFLVAALLVARLLRGSDELTGWLSSCMSGAAVVYVSITIATAAATAAALYTGHHGASLDAITAVDTIGNFGFSLSGAAAGLYVLAASGAGQATRLLPRWFAVAGYVIGVALIGGVPAAKAGAPQMMLWFLWLVVLGVVLLRRSRAMAGLPARSAVPATA